MCVDVLVLVSSIGGFWLLDLLWIWMLCRWHNGWMWSLGLLEGSCYLLVAVLGLDCWGLLGELLLAVLLFVLGIVGFDFGVV